MQYLQSVAARPATLARSTLFFAFLSFGLIGLFIGWLPLQAAAQFPPRLVNHQPQFWWSVNSTGRISNKWSIVGDVHIRRNNFIADPSFYFLRFGGQYNLLPNFSLTAGYAHMWIAPSRSDWQSFVNENRIYQQAVLVNTVGSVNLLSRIRNEQRWQQIIVDDKPSGRWRFTNRVRYLVSATIPVSKNRWVPRPVLSNELLVHFGKPVLYNAFDQNRVFIGIRQQVSLPLSFDFGYMNVYQQKFSGFEYDMNHTIRLFFYYSPDLRKGKRPRLSEPIQSPDE
jgi:hypothetical protein